MKTVEIVIFYDWNVCHFSASRNEKLENRNAIWECKMSRNDESAAKKMVNVDVFRTVLETNKMRNQNAQFWTQIWNTNAVFGYSFGFV